MRAGCLRGPIRSCRTNAGVIAKPVRTRSAGSIAAMAHARKCDCAWRLIRIVALRPALDRAESNQVREPQADGDAIVISACGVSSHRDSAGGVPPVRKCKQGPGQIVVVGRMRRRAVERHQTGHDVLPGDRLNSRSDGIQQSLKFGFAHGALPIEERNVAKLPSFLIERIVQIAIIRRRRLVWLASCS